MTGEIVPATMFHAEHMASNLRPGDLLEVEATGMSPVECLKYCVASSIIAWAWVIDGQVACMFGLQGTITSDSANGWLLSTPLVDKYRFAFLRQCKAMLKRARLLYPKLEQFCDIKYHKSLKWAKWMGFDIDGPFEVGPLKRSFLRLRIE